MLTYVRFSGCVEGSWGEDHYRILGLKRGCSLEEVEQMYCCFWAPNRKQRMAYAVLRDADRRVVYDDWLTAVERSRGWRSVAPAWLWVLVDRFCD